MQASQLEHTLTTTLLVERALHRRDNSDSDPSLCPSVKFVSPNSLIFHTHCGKTLAKSADAAFLATAKSPSFEDCMSNCGIYGPPCYAVAYNESTNHCIFYGEIKDTIIGDDGDDTVYDVGIANADQLSIPTSDRCEFPGDGATHTTDSGLLFEISCNTDWGADGGDYCADNYSLEDWKCTPHANSMAECLEICSKAHPLCKGVSFGRDMVSG